MKLSSLSQSWKWRTAIFFFCDNSFVVGVFILEGGQDPVSISTRKGLNPHLGSQQSALTTRLETRHAKSTLSTLSLLIQSHWADGCKIPRARFNKHKEA